MRIHRSSVAVLATVVSLASGGGVAWACTGGGPGDPGSYGGTTTGGTTGTTTSGTTTSADTTSAGSSGTTTSATTATQGKALKNHASRKTRHNRRHTRRS